MMLYGIIDRVWRARCNDLGVKDNRRHCRTWMMLQSRSSDIEIRWISSRHKEVKRVQNQPQCRRIERQRNGLGKSSRWPTQQVAMSTRVMATCGGAASACYGADGTQESLVQQLVKFVDSNYIPLALLTAASLGWMFPGPGVVALTYNVQHVSTVGIFLISGLILQPDQVVVALKSIKAVLYGVFSILFITPLLGLVLMKVPMYPMEMQIGMTVFCSVPTTLSTCVALSNACKGNAAVALLLVVITSFLGVFTIPVMLGLSLGSLPGSLTATSFDSVRLLKSLAMTILLPLSLGLSLQIFRAVRTWRDANKKFLGRLSTLCLCILPWIQVSKASYAKLPIGVDMVGIALGLGVVVHLIYLAFNVTVTSLIRFNKDEEENLALRKALILCTSEKTLPVAVAVIGQLGAILGNGVGLAVLPCVFSHIIQIVIDSAIVSVWNSKNV